MIGKQESRLTPSQAAKEFAELHGLFSGELFVKIVVYADETGTHDPTGALPGAREAGIVGFAAPIEDWTHLVRKWQAVLNKYKAKYFHFSDWSSAFHALRKGETRKGPYSHLDAEQLDALVMELAIIAGGGSKCIVGECIHVDVFHQKKESGEWPKDANPYNECASRFFKAYVRDIKTYKPVWQRTPTQFFFDQTDNADFRRAIDAAFQEAKKTHPNFRGFAFWDKKDELPLQAADMVAYRTRQLMQNYVNDTMSPNWLKLDEALFKPMYSFFECNPERLRKMTNFASFHKACYDAFKKKTAT